MSASTSTRERREADQLLHTPRFCIGCGILVVVTIPEYAIEGSNAAKFKDVAEVTVWLLRFAPNFSDVQLENAKQWCYAVFLFCRVKM